MTAGFRVQSVTNVYSAMRAEWGDAAKIAIMHGNGTALTYRDVDRISARMAGALVRLGVRKGDRVAAQTDKSPEALLLCLACFRVGAVYLPLNTAYMDAEVDYFLKDAAPTVFVVGPAAFETSARLSRNAGVAACLTLGHEGQGTLMDAALGLPEAFDDVACAEDDLAAILYTSGTTGRSKGAMLTHGNLLSNALALIEMWRFTSADVLLHALPIFHTHGLFVACNVALLSGASMLFLPKFDANEVFRLLPQATVMMGVPTFYTRLVEDARLTREATAHIRLFVSGSAPLLAETHRAFEERTGQAILERYGMTETGMITSNPYDGPRLPGAVGFPLPGVSVRIADPADGAPVERGEIGMIEVRGPNVFKGYWRMPEKTEAEFRKDGYFITGDLGKVDPSGYIHIVGRGKDLVITGGYNVYPKEVESEIDALDGVAESAVIGVPHKDFGEAVVAVVVGTSLGSLTEDGILAALKSRLAGYKLPKRVVFATDLPRNAMGKIQKNVLRDNQANLFAA